jgi:hypothetical protein
MYENLGSPEAAAALAAPGAAAADEGVVGAAASASAPASEALAVAAESAQDEQKQKWAAKIREGRLLEAERPVDHARVLALYQEARACCSEPKTKAVLEGKIAKLSAHLRAKKMSQPRRKYDDYKRMETMRLKAMEERASAKRAGDQEGVSVGDKVEAFCRGGKVHHPGQIVCDNHDGTYEVIFDDGDRDPKVALRSIKKRPRYAKESDNQNCKFRPAIKGAKPEAPTWKKVGEEFLARASALEVDKQKKLSTTRGNEQYDTRLDKKICPKCGNKQSYDEIVDRRKACPNCRESYGNAKAWGGAVFNSFMGRLESTLKNKEDRHQAILQQINKDHHERDFVNAAGQKLERKLMDVSRKCGKDLVSFEGRNEFYAEHKAQVAKRNQDLHSAEVTCSFHPLINSFVGSGGHHSDRIYRSAPELSMPRSRSAGNL